MVEQIKVETVFVDSTKEMESFENYMAGHGNTYEMKLICKLEGEYGEMVQFI